MQGYIKKALEDETDQLVREIIDKGVDGIIAGWPCQDISWMGKGAGIQGLRSGLWRNVYRAIRLVRPAFAVLENVAALLHRGMGKVFGDLAAIGYDAEWHCIRASDVGLPHERERIFVIAYPHSERGERYFPQTIQGQRRFSWFQDVRRLEDLPERCSLYESQLCRSGHGIRKRLDATGNGNPPEIIRQITKGLKK